MAKTLFTAGHFEKGKEKFSKIADQIYKGLSITDADYFNGGSFQDLEKIVSQVKDYGLIFWFADVPNEMPKLVHEIKEKNKACVLITSKRNTEGKYSFSDLLFHALGNKSNLAIEFTKKEDRYFGRIFDPLGNVFLDYSPDFYLAGKVLGKRAEELSSYKRISSEQIGDKLEAPNQDEFFELVKEYANVFHNLIHSNPESANRFFGNASFRCERGFPSFSSDGLIFVSKRNIDKRYIEKNSFVAVKKESTVRYFGAEKPSVDTPIQIALYEYYSKARFMLHSHTYIDSALFTESIIPCGALEEADEINKVFPDRDSVNFCINLKGHGSLAVVNSPDYLKNIPYRARDLPEIHEEYSIGFKP